MERQNEVVGIDRHEVIEIGSLEIEHLLIIDDPGCIFGGVLILASDAVQVHHGVDEHQRSVTECDIIGDYRDQMFDLGDTPGGVEGNSCFRSDGCDQLSIIGMDTRFGVDSGFPVDGSVEEIGQEHRVTSGTREDDMDGKRSGIEDHNILQAYMVRLSQDIISSDERVVTMELGEDQQQVIEAVTSAWDTQFFTLTGYAGTGKTLTASKIIDDPRFNEVLILAPTAAALNALKRKFEGVVSDKVTFRTIASLISRPIPQLVFPNFKMSFDSNTRCVEDINGFIRRHFSVASDFNVCDSDYVIESSADLTFDVDQLSRDLRTTVEDGVRFVIGSHKDVANTIVSHRWDLVVIDEYSMVSQEVDELFTDVVDDLMLLSAIPVVFMACGDPGQLPPVKETINRRIIGPVDQVTHFELTTVRRSDDVIAHLAERLRFGDSLAQMALRSDIPMVQACPMDPDQMFARYGRWMVSGDSTVVLTWTNKDKDRFNQLVRAGRGLTGSIQVGDHIVVKKNVYAGPGVIGWANGEVNQVIDVGMASDIESMVDEAVAHLDDRIKSDEDAVEQAESNGLSEDEIESLSWNITSLKRDQEKIRQQVPEIQRLIDDEIVSLVLLDDDYQQRYAFVRSDVTRPYDRGWRELQKRLRSFGQKIGVAHIEADFAYAMTVHTAQGSEFDQVVYAAAGWHLWRQASSSWDGKDWHAPYTAITRAKKGLLVLFQP